MIDGLSQSTGAERLVELKPDGGNVRLAIRARGADTEMAFASVPAGELMAVLTDTPEGPQKIAGAEESALQIEVRRNEVLLEVGTADAAVGLDDLTDALASALPPA